MRLSKLGDVKGMGEPHVPSRIYVRQKICRMEVSVSFCVNAFYSRLSFKPCGVYDVDYNGLHFLHGEIGYFYLFYL
jgi:hypothetical protein